MQVRRYTFEVESVLANTETALVWQHMTAWARINSELWPLSMSHPDEFPSVNHVPADGIVHFVSQVKLGCMPLDMHRFALQELVEGEYFLERSSTLFLQEWTHKRIIRQVEEKVVLTDTCSLTPKMALLGRFLAIIYHNVFLRRHKKLRLTFGT